MFIRISFILLICHTFLFSQHQSFYCATDQKHQALLSTDADYKKLYKQIQDNIYKKALSFREENTYHADTWEEFTDIIENKTGFVYAHWDGPPGTSAPLARTTHRMLYRPREMSRNV